MISALYSTCHQPAHLTEQQTSCLCKTSMIVLEFLLVGAGCAIYFSGVGVVPAAVFWGAPLIIEVSALIYEVSKQRSEISISQSITTGDEEEEAAVKKRKCEFFKELKTMGLTESVWESDSETSFFFDNLMGNRILALDSAEERGLSVIPGTYIPKNLPSPEFANQWCSGMDDNEDFDCSMVTEWLYIASGPQNEEEVDAFWYLINYCEKPPLIVMATECMEERCVNLAELKIERTTVCQHYWPDASQPLHADFCTVNYAGEDVIDGKITSRDFIVKDNFSSNSRRVAQFFINGWAFNKPFDDFPLLYAYTSACLKQIEEQKKTVVVHDDNGKGRAGAFALCLILQAVHEAAKKSNVHAIVDLKKLVAVMRYSFDCGRDGLIDLPCHYDTIVKFAEYLKNTP